MEKKWWIVIVLVIVALIFISIVEKDVLFSPIKQSKLQKKIGGEVDKDVDRTSDELSEGSLEAEELFEKMLEKASSVGEVSEIGRINNEVRRKLLAKKEKAISKIEKKPIIKTAPDSSNKIRTSEVGPVDANFLARMETILENGVQRTIEGQVQLIHMDYFDDIDFNNLKSDYQFYLISSGGEFIKLYPTSGISIQSGTIARVTGSEFEGEIVFDSYDVIQQPPPTVPVIDVNLGGQSTIVLLINYQDNPIEPISYDDMWNFIFNMSNISSLNSYINETSYGQTWLEGDLFGWYTVPIDSTDVICSAPAYQLFQYVDPLIDFSNYKRLIIINPQPPGCWVVGGGSTGLTTLITDDGSIELSGSGVLLVDPEDFWFMRFIQTLRHEFGHNLGMGHAEDLECTDSVIGDNCEYIDYGDFFSAMASGWFLYTIELTGHYNAPHKELIGFLDSQNILEINSWGTYSIEPFETNTGGVKALKIPAGEYNYYIEYRRPIGYDEGISIISQTLPEINIDGAMLHVDRFPIFLFWPQSFLLDNSPTQGIAQFTDSLDVVIKEGESFYDLENSIYITTISATDNQLEVYVGLPDCGNGVVDFGEDCDGGNLNT